MSANSGIGVSPELTSAWNAALGDRTVRFLKVVIRNGQSQYLRAL
jgi:hypothetical protein